ncbi:MAG: bifunctional demethylmenaquinone methyltransferase/2-methoxy-6-polyprenyl-1,4-benzoquinol methylase UbiE [Deltaproteobacteria bacterium]|nr:bifunctional demethylmenaquinone methyltransferase/2-methoxy-6-polyprenyl-1,4-benzoquinol methylase UbiE [Deltaproteobacteria bacterium]
MDTEPTKEANGKNYPSVTGIGRDEHVGMVREIFATITGRYDFLNHLLSLRRDIAWRRFAVRRMRFFSTFRLLDVATGTADLAIEAAKGHPGVHVMGIDFAPEMLAVGQRKITERGLAERIRLLQADAMTLPFPDGSFDAVGIAFGIRNMPDRLRALREMRRVLVPGGRLFVLEMNSPRSRLWRGFFAPYLNRILPVIARLFSRNPAAYLYLVDSITHFPAPPAFLALMEEAGFGNRERYSLTFGITSLYIGSAGDNEEKTG